MSIAEDSTSTAVMRALAILEEVAQRGSLSNSEISRSLEIPKSSASYLLRALEKRGYVHRDTETGRYRLGLKILSLSHGVLQDHQVREVAAPLLRHLVERIQMSAHLSVLDHGEAVYIDKVEAPGFIKMDTWIGKRMKVHATGVGKVLLAWLPEKEIEEIIRQQGLARRTPKTITTQSKLLTDLERVRQQGYGVDDEENSLGVRCVAAPVFDSQSQVIAAVGVSGTTLQNDLDHLPKVADLVRQAARSISHQLGAPGTKRRG